MQGLTPSVLVGRARELAELRLLLDRARTGGGGAALILAEAGGGKTSLAAATAALAAEAGLATLWGTASPTTSGVPLLPVAAALNNALAAVDLEALRSRLRSAHRLARVVAPGLFPDEAAPPNLDEAAKVAVFEAVLAVVCELAAGRGVLVVLDDLQWADATTQQLTSHLATRAPNAGLALLTTWRDTGEEQVLQDLRRQPGLLTLPLRPLTLEEVARVGRLVLGAPPRPDLAVEVAELSRGNPFAAAELFAASGRADGVRGLPASGREAIIGRLDGLQPGDEAVLQAAAVLDGEFDGDILATILRRSETAVEGALARLATRGLMTPLQGGRHQFRHALIAGAVRSRVTERRLRELHAAAAGALRRAGAPPAQLAHHLFAAGLAKEAIPAAIAAAEAAENQGSNFEAADLYERAADATPDPAAAGRLLGRAAWAAGLALQAERSSELAARALELLASTGQPTGRVRATLAHALTGMLDIEGSARAGRAAIAELEAAGPSRELAEALMIVGGNEMGQWHPEEALVLGQRSAEVAKQVGDTRTLIPAQGIIATCLGMLGHYDQAIAEIDGMIERALAVGFHRPAIAGTNNVGIMRVLALRGREAVDRLEGRGPEPYGVLGPQVHRIRAAHLAVLGEPRQALAAIDAATLLTPLEHKRLAQARAFALFQLNRVDEAAALLAESPADPGSRFGHYSFAPLVWLAAGERDRAASAARDALEEPDPDLNHWARGAEVAAEVLLQLGGRARVATAYRARRNAAPEDSPWWPLVVARLALDSDPESAAATIRPVAERFAAARYEWDEGRAWLLLAQALGAAGHRQEAVDVLHEALANAKRHDIAYHARLAREGLAALGDRGDALDAHAIRQLLERLDDTPAPLRDRLLAAIDALTQAKGQEGEAGAILRDYYVKRVGSQEVVAERHYLTRPTFYRRLHLGWELLAERLGPLLEAPAGSARNV